MKKKILSFIMAAVTAASTLLFPLTASAVDKVKGIEWYDSSLAKHHSIGSYDGTVYTVTQKTGDLDRDGFITVADASILSAYVKRKYSDAGNVIIQHEDCFPYHGFSWTETDYINFFGDINKDGAVNVTDVSLLTAHVKGIRRTNTSKCTWKWGWWFSEEGYGLFLTIHRNGTEKIEVCSPKPYC